MGEGGSTLFSSFKIKLKLKPKQIYANTGINQEWLNEGGRGEAVSTAAPKVKLKLKLKLKPPKQQIEWEEIASPRKKQKISEEEDLASHPPILPFIISMSLQDDECIGGECSKNSLVAKNGFRAEVAMCSQENIKQSFELYFDSTIKCLTRIHGKKCDIRIEFENGTETTIQNKDGGGKGRGWSVDRRKVDAFKDERLTTLLKTLCLKQGTEKPIISNNISKNVITMCILGSSIEEYPKYFTHTISDKSSGNIISMSICPTDTLMEFMYGELYKVMEPKRTCVHLNPNCYLQRKGGGKKDHAPDNIQMKFRFTETVEKLFTTIFTQTRSQ